MSPSNHLPPADPVGSVFADAPSGMFITSPRGRILHVNPAFLRSGVHAPDFYTRLRQSLRETGVWRGQMGAAARRHGRQVVVCYLDIDGFKGINDSLGHHAGDRVLVEVARRLGWEIRSGDSPARRVSRSASGSPSFRWTMAAPIPCCAMPTPPCIRPSVPADLPTASSTRWAAALPISLRSGAAWIFRSAAKVPRWPVQSPGVIRSLPVTRRSASTFSASPACSMT